MGSGLEPGYIALLGLAENFLKKSPNHPGYRVNPAGVLPAVKCLGAIFRLNPRPPTLIEVRTHLQLGALLHRETQNVDLAKQHLEQAWYQSQSLPQLEDVKYEAGCCLAEIFSDAGQIVQAKQVLQKAIESSQRLPYWHCRLLFQLANLLVTEKDYNSAVQILDAGVNFSYMAGAYYTRMLFLLSKAMLFLLERRFADANPILQQTGPLIETWVQQNTHQKESVAKHQKEYLQIFFLVLQVCYYLMVGQVKSVKTVLKQLQQSIQTVTSPGWPADEEMVPTNAADNFQWLTKDHLCILVYLVTVMHSMQAGYMDKAQKYTDKAIAQIDKLRNSYDAKPLLLSSFQALLMEHIVQCRLVTGNKEGAVQEIGNLCRLLQSNQLLLQRHRAQLHTMLGLYAMSMNCMDAAENQFNAALRTSRERELWTFANLNLAIVYVRTRRETDFAALLDRISPERLPSQSHSLQAAAYYIQGLQEFFSAKYNDAKRYLRETLKMANAEDLNRLTVCALVLLGHIFLSLGNSKESMNMVNPAMQLSSKIPDTHVQLWASAILKDLHRMDNNPQHEEEGSRMHKNFSQTLLQDHFRASQLQEHNLIEWTDGPFPALPPASVNTTSVPRSS
eukprot:10140.XXX_173463_175626_1 [CDS] Oithona nana genome sequencing.